MTDPLADLELGTTPVAPAPALASAAAAPALEDTETEDTRDEVEVGEIEVGLAEFIPTAQRTAGGSKYPFAQLPAPQEKDGKTLYGNFVVKLLPNVDPDKLRRSVQSATTQANKQGKNEGKYFVSRAINKEGKFVGMGVYRTDTPPAK